MDSNETFTFVTGFISGAVYMGLAGIMVAITHDLHSVLRRHTKPRYKRKGN